jgi:1-acyl-sn-glycerol-3-phosphate acyltransferase
VARLLGFDVVTTGMPVAARPVLFVGNHVSYLDICVLGSVIEGCFVAKSEIAGWPLFGWLAKLQRTVFVERRRSRARSQRDDISRRLAKGDNLILFPEGTSDDGIHVLPFRSALFAVAEREVAGRPLLIQPFSIAYTRLGDLPMVRDWRPLCAWYGDMDLGGHLWRVLGLGRIEARVVFHQPVTLAGFADRKALADHCHSVVRDGVIAANSGLLPAPAADAQPAPAA